MGFVDRIDFVIVLCNCFVVLGALLALAGIFIGIRYESKLIFLVCSCGAFAAVVFSCVIYMAVGYAMRSI